MLLIVTDTTPIYVNFTMSVLLWVPVMVPKTLALQALFFNFLTIYQPQVEMRYNVIG